MGTVTPYSAFKEASQKKKGAYRDLSLRCLDKVYTDLKLSSQDRSYNFKKILTQLLEEGQSMSEVFGTDNALSYGTRREVVFVVGSIYPDEFMAKAIDGYKISLDESVPGKYDNFSEPSQLFNAMLAEGEMLSRLSHDMRAIPQLQTRYAIAPYGAKFMATAMVLTVKDQFKGGLDTYINHFLNTSRHDRRQIQERNRENVFKL